MKILPFVFLLFCTSEFYAQSSLGTISGAVWNDLNGNGSVDGGEPGIQGAFIFLDTNNNGVFDGGEPITISNAAGNYNFIALSAGTYNVRVDLSTLPSGFALTTSNLPAVINLSAGQNVNNLNFGFQQQNATIGDFVWNDLNGNAVQDGGEPGIPGVTIYLDLNGNGVIDGGEPFSTSDGAGAYDITNLPTGTYTVRVDPTTIPSGFIFTGAMLSPTVNLTAGEDFNDADFAFQQQNATIGDFVWNDLNGNAVQDGGEPGIPGVTIYLDLNGNGVIDGGEPFSTSDGAGAYDITNLPTGTYTVRVDPTTIPSGFIFTGAMLSPTVNLTAGEDFNDADFGYEIPYIPTLSEWGLIILFLVFSILGLVSIKYLKVTKVLNS